MRRRLAILALVLPLGLAGLPAAATAQERSLDIERFRPTPDRWGFLGIPGTRTPGEWAWDASLWVGYASQQLALRRPATGETIDVVAHRATADLVAQLGITGRVAVVLDAPMVAWQDADAEALDAGPALANSALRDPFVAVRVRVLGAEARADHDRAEGEGVALQLGGTLPFGLEDALAGEGAPQLEGMAIADYHFLDFAVGLNVGYRHRFGEPQLFGVLFRNELFFGGAIQTPTILLANTSAIVEVRAVTGLDQEVFAEASTAVEGDLGVRWAEEDLALTWMVGTGFNGGVGTPSFRGMFALELAPRTHDRDHDGLDDADDECPDLPEDLDGFEDENGCPDLDNDGDLIPDDDDRCPAEPAEFDQDEDEDGCTDPVRDADRDGIPDGDDACPGQPEDRDDFEDDDGCPDPDDDGDGVPDGQDRCAREAEDVDGFEDDDGCPDPDNDADGVGDGADRCPTEPEDRDGFEDDDGCPDPDNDRDGVLDAADQCADQAETINGVDDDDGCPDRGGSARWRDEDGAWVGRLRFGADGALRALSIGAVDQLARRLIAGWGRAYRITLSEGEPARAGALDAALRERGVPEGRYTIAIDDARRGWDVRVTPTSAEEPAPPSIGAPPVE